MARKRTPAPTHPPLQERDDGVIAVRPAALHALLSWACTETGHAMASVRIEPHGDRLVLVATDGHRLLALSTARKPGAPAIAGVVDRDTAERALRVAKATGDPALLAPDPTVEGYPPWREAMASATRPADGPRGTVKMKSAYLADIALVSRAIDAGFGGVMVTLHGPRDPVVVRAHDHDASWLGLIMPMLSAEDDMRPVHGVEEVAAAE